MYKYLFLLSFNLIAITLQEAYNNADSFEEYEKYVILDPSSIYTGGLGIFEGDVYINCNGSIIDLQEGNGIWIYADETYPSSLEIEHCTIINSLYYGVSYGGTSNGSIKNCNLINTNFGVKLFDQSNVNIINSIFAANNSVGVAMYTEDPTLHTSYSLFWENADDCMENCPGWGSIWTQLELEPGTGVIYDNPQFIDINSLNFNLQESSPCINAGSPDIIDEDGTLSDIGAYYSNNICLNQGDINNDNIINVIDITLGICVILNNSFEDCNAECSWDMNSDGVYNVIDIILIIDVIIN